MQGVFCLWEEGHLADTSRHCHCVHPSFGRTGCTSGERLMERGESDEGCCLFWPCCCFPNSCEHWLLFVFVACHQTEPEPRLWQDSGVGRGGNGGSAYKELSDLHHKVRILRLLFGSYSCNALSETTLKLRMSHLKLYCKLGIRKSSPSYSFWI